MKFDKETIVVILIAGVLLLAWFFIFPKWQAKQITERERIAAEAAAALAQQNAKNGTAASAGNVAASAVATPVAGQQNPSPTATTSTTAAPDVSGKTVASGPVPVSHAAWKPEEISNQFATATVNADNGSVAVVKLLGYKTSDKQSELQIGEASPSKTFEIVLPSEFKSAGESAPELKDGKLTLVKNLIDPTGRHLRMTSTYVYRPDSYQIALTLSFQNETVNPVILPEVTIWTAGLPPLKELAGDNLYNERHNVDYYLASGSLKTFDPSAKEEKFKTFDTDQSVSWIGSTNKFFASMLFAKDPFNGGARLIRSAFPKKDKPAEVYYVPSIGGVYRNLDIPGNGVKTLDFTYYCGPKEMKQIKMLPASAMDAMHLSYFSWMDFLARPLVWLLNYLKGLSGSYGWAIILLTCIVRIVFWPITQKANNSMRKMQKIQPKVTELREKYKGNPQEMNVKMMELYRTEKVNPLGGCLPILLQLPVFFALYSALDSAVELRQISFWWITDMSKPDLIGPQITLPFLGPTGLHPLVLIMTGLMVLQQKMTPSMADPMQQKMMMLMPVIMLVMLYNLPAGLTLYWTVSQIFSIIQLKYGQIVARMEEAKEAQEKAASPAKL